MSSGVIRKPASGPASVLPDSALVLPESGFVLLDSALVLPESGFVLRQGIDRTARNL